MTRVCFITTVQHNVGDDFVREGLLYLLERVCGRLRPSLIHKHLPITARPEFSWIHDLGLDHWINRKRSQHQTLRLTSMIDRRLPVFPWSDRVRRCEILVQSGAPIYWAHSMKDCKDNEWWWPLIERRWAAVSGGRPFLNLAGGTCQRWGSDGSEFADRPATLAYIRRFFDLTALTTVRDTLSVRVLELAGRVAQALPCSSIFAVDQLGIAPMKGEYVALNYMPGGGHFSFGQPVDPQVWEQAFVSFARKLAARTKCVLVCHDDKELRAAQMLLPELDRFHSRHHADYLRFYARARWGLMNRVHGAFALASLGKPATVVGTDSRAQMTEMIGLRSIFVNQADLAWLESEAARLEAESQSFPQAMGLLKEAAEQQYLKLLKSALGAGS